MPMRFFADLHVHSKHARATSRDLDLPHMALWAAKKGVLVLGTGDFTHPVWFADIRGQLVPAEPGLFRLKPEFERWCAERFPPFAAQPTRFLLQVEISTIYKQGDRVRKVHHCHYVPDLAAAERFIARLARIGNLTADGRPILGLNSRHLLEITLEAGPGSYLIPAHIWTPWFAVLGSKSGFDSIADCYGDLTPEIFAVETGLSSDPPMNRRLAQLDRYALVSSSDAHSPGKIGREASAFDCELSWWAMRDALRTGASHGGTVEFFPEEGKYHLDGHRACGIRWEPGETQRHGGLCPVCGKELTVGVLHRVEALADRAEGAPVKAARMGEFRSFVPLPELLGEVLRVGPASRRVTDSYERLVGAVGPELFILEHAPLEDLRRAGPALLAEGVRRMRAGEVIREAGYDGEYGVIRVFRDEELIQGNAVSLLFELPKAERAAGLLPAPTPAAETRGEESPELADAGTGAVPQRAAGSPLLAALDTEQRAAAEILSGPLVVIAGPGTGKTRTLTHRLAYLMEQDVPPSQLLAVTFTNRAANELRERLAALRPARSAGLRPGANPDFLRDDADPAAPLVTTFHGLGFRLLREFGSRLGLPAALKLAGEAEREALLAAKLALTPAKAAALLRKLSTWKRTGQTPDAEAGQLLAAYEATLHVEGWLDFDDLITRAVVLLEAHADVLAQVRERCRHLCVDEFQDVDARQYRLVTLLAGGAAVPGRSVCVIGDPDQAIYGFRGAEPRFFAQFAADFPGTREIRLTRNYRSTRAIVDAAVQAIAPVSLVAGRVMEALHADASRLTIHAAASDRAEAEFVVHTIEQLLGGTALFSLDSGRVDGTQRPGGLGLGDFAVLCRTDAQADALAEALDRAGLPYQRHGHAPLAGRAEVAALLERLRELTADQELTERLAQIRPGEASSGQASLLLTLALEPIARRCGADLAAFEAELALLTENDLHDPRADRIALLTLHASKGLEFPVVFLTGCEDGVLPLRFGPDTDAAQVAEERRLFFVGLTRARERLFLTHARRRLWHGQVRDMAASPFLDAIERELVELSRAPVRPRPEKPDATQLVLIG